jgi:hypothetical protein
MQCINGVGECFRNSNGMDGIGLSLYPGTMGLGQIGGRHSMKIGGTKFKKGDLS